MAKDLTPAKCVLLAIHYASEGNIKALESLTHSRPDALKPKLILRILLTYLPESVEPREYTHYVREVCSSSARNVAEDVEIDTAPVEDIEEGLARKRVKRLKLFEIRPAEFLSDLPDDLLTEFLCHRAYRIDAEAGLLNLIPQLVEPFLENNAFLRSWYTGTVLPLFRLQFEYYPQDESQVKSLVEFGNLDGKESVGFLMYNASKMGTADKGEVVRDVRGLVGPWVYGQSEWKRRRLEHSYTNGEESAEGFPELVDHSTSSEDAGHDWSYLYRWMVSESQANFSLITETVENWDGPGDVDLGGLGPDKRDEETQAKLQLQYVQTALASCYAVESDTERTIYDAHRMLTRLSILLDFDPPPDLTTSVESLPKLERHTLRFDNYHSSLDLEPESLLNPHHPLTQPWLDSYMILYMVIYSAYQFSVLNSPDSIANVARLRFNAPADEQLAVLQRILRGLVNGGARRDEELWIVDLGKLRWLWNWGDDVDSYEASSGVGVFGNMSKQAFEEEILKGLVDTSSYNLAISQYLKPSTELLPSKRIEQIALIKAMEAYDSASNGNRSRGGMKKAFDIVSLFRPFFPHSIAFRQAMSLISATHSLSFYSLTLQHGVPFQPVTIRVSQDPIGLISKLLDQNPGSYTQLDDLIGIAQSLVSAGLPQQDVSAEATENESEVEAKRKNAKRRVTLMAVEAALHEDDFETAYSYIVSRLTPSGAEIKAPRSAKQNPKQHARNVSNSSTRSRSGEHDDDISWRAPFLAGRYRPSTASPPSLRRLEQRTELLSLALLLAPVAALSEILAAWRKCEEEATALQLSQQQAEEELDDRADKRQSTGSIPGNFVLQGEQPALLYNQKRREMGRLTGKASGDEAPVSMFDLTRSAAQAISKNAFPLRAASRPSSSRDIAGMESSVDSLGSDGGTEGKQRTRRRDMVANAVSGGLASGLGWVLGATPVQEQRTDDR